MSGCRAQGILGTAAAFVLIAAAQAVSARPFTLDDVLAREDLGAIEQAGPQFVVERRGPTLRAARFDLDANQDIERTTLWVLDPSRPGSPRPLFKPSRGAGYALGPVSPDGAQVAVMRLTATRWELGIADVARRQVRWLGLTPEKTADLATLTWASNQQLLAIVNEAAAPGAFRHRRELPKEAPRLWRQTAAGGVAVRVVESGRLAWRPLDRRSLVSIDATTGQRRTLLAGPLIGLSLSPPRTRVAVMVEGADHPMARDHPVQDTYGFEANEHHLVLVDLEAGSATEVTRSWDVLPHPLAWSDDGQELIGFGRDRVAPWATGRFLRIDARTGTARPIDSIHAALDLRPEAARAGWFAGAPVVWGAARGGGPPAWWRITKDGPTPLVPAELGVGKSGLSRTPGGWLAAGSRGIWRLSPNGPPVLVAPGIKPITYPQTNRAFVFDYEIAQPDHVVGRTVGGDLVAVRADGQTPLPVAARDTEVLRPSEALDGLLVRGHPKGGVLDLVWAPRQGRAETLLHLNASLADLDEPELHAIHHLGVSGETLTSWLLLPAKSPGPLPPLIVRPYPGARYPTPPGAMDSRTGGPDKSAALLAAHGYAVLAPSLPIPTGAEPADHLADHILAIIDAAAADPGLKGRFDPARLGIWGQSFGGYGTLATITQTDRFAAAVAESSMSDLVSVWGQFMPTLRIDPSIEFSPFYTQGWVEDLQGGMHAPPWADPQRYVRNSPVFHADRVTTPLLLFHGDQDGFSVGQAEEMFSALARQNKAAELVTYFGEGHAFASPGTLRDQYARVFRWFDAHLLTTVDAAHPPANPGSASASGARTPR